MNDFLTLAKERFSVRDYKDIPIEEEKMKKILEAGQVAPTAGNRQPQRVYVVTSKEKREAMKEATKCTFDAPVIFAIGYDPSEASSGQRFPGNGFGETDSAIVCTHMMLEAWDLGIGTCWVGLFKSEDVKRVLGLPENIVITDLLPAGYPADDAKPYHLHDEVRPLEETVTFM